MAGVLDGKVTIVTGGGTGIGEAIAREVDEEVAKILAASHERAVGLLRDKREDLEHLTSQLLAQETISGDASREVLGPAAKSSTRVAASSSS